MNINPINHTPFTARPTLCASRTGATTPTEEPKPTTPMGMIEDYLKNLPISEKAKDYWRSEEGSKELVAAIEHREELIKRIDEKRGYRPGVEGVKSVREQITDGGIGGYIMANTPAPEKRDVFNSVTAPTAPIFFSQATTPTMTTISYAKPEAPKSALPTVGFETTAPAAAKDYSFQVTRPNGASNPIEAPKDYAYTTSFGVTSGPAPLRSYDVPTTGPSELYLEQHKIVSSQDMTPTIPTHSPELKDLI